MNALTSGFQSSVTSLREKRESVTVRQPETGIVTFEEFLLNGKRDRNDGPACVWRDGKTGRVIAELWYRNGKLDRADGPAWIERDSVTGLVTREDWYRNDQRERRVDYSPSHEQMQISLVP